jgi:hypothetical protein
MAMNTAAWMAMAIHQPIGMTLPSLDGKLPLFSLFPGLLSIAQNPHMCGDFALILRGSNTI